MRSRERDDRLNPEVQQSFSRLFIGIDRSMKPVIASVQNMKQLKSTRVLHLAVPMIALRYVYLAFEIQNAGYFQMLP